MHNHHHHETSQAHDRNVGHGHQDHRPNIDMLDAYRHIAGLTTNVGGFLGNLLQQDLDFFAAPDIYGGNSGCDRRATSGDCKTPNSDTTATRNNDNPAPPINASDSGKPSDSPNQNNASESENPKESLNPTIADIIAANTRSQDTVLPGLVATDNSAWGGGATGPFKAGEAPNNTTIPTTGTNGWFIGFPEKGSTINPNDKIVVSGMTEKILSKDGTWRTVSGTESNGGIWAGAYPHNFDGTPSTGVDMSTNADGSYNLSGIDGAANPSADIYHGGIGGGGFDPANDVGVVVSLNARVDQSAGSDAKYVMQVGNDFYGDTASGKVNTGASGNSNWFSLTNTDKTLVYTSLTAEQLAGNPPPGLAASDGSPSAGNGTSDSTKTTDSTSQKPESTPSIEQKSGIAVGTVSEVLSQSDKSNNQVLPGYVTLHADDWSTGAMGPLASNVNGEATGANGWFIAFPKEGSQINPQDKIVVSDMTQWIHSKNGGWRQSSGSESTDGLWAGSYFHSMGNNDAVAVNQEQNADGSYSFSGVDPIADPGHDVYHGGIGGGEYNPANDDGVFLSLKARVDGAPGSNSSYVMQTGVDNSYNGKNAGLISNSNWTELSSQDQALFLSSVPADVLRNDPPPGIV